MRVVLKPGGLLILFAALSILIVIASAKSKVKTAVVTKTPIATATPAPLPNLLGNGDIEDGADKPLEWTNEWSESGKMIVSRDPTVVHGGKSSLRLEFQEGHGKGQVADCVGAGAPKYRLSGYVKVEGTGAFSLALQVYDKAWKPIGFEHVQLMSGTQGWTHVERTISVSKDGAFVGAVAYMDGSGKLWVDDVVLNEVK